MLLNDIARELVAFSSDIMEGRIVNVMDPEGIIIASTEEGRVGSFHEGAAEVVRTGKAVVIEPENVAQYKDAKQGCNMPIRIDGEIVGVIGVYGNPSEIRPLARWLEAFAEKYYQLEAMAVPRLAEMELRARLLRNLLFPSEQTFHNAQLLMKELHYEPVFPAVLAVMTPTETVTDPSWATDLSRVLQEKKLIRAESDLWGVENRNNCMVILAKDTSFGEKIRRSGLLSPEGRYAVSIGDICRELWDVPRAFEQAVVLSTTTALPYTDVNEPGNRCRYLIRRAADHEREFLKVRMERLEEAFSEEELHVVLRSAAVYYHESHSVSKAAEKLFIHKNTLQYRMRRLESVLDLEDWPEFRKEYLIRLLMEHYKGKQGLKTLL